VTAGQSHSLMIDALRPRFHPDSPSANICIPVLTRLAPMSTLNSDKKCP